METHLHCPSGIRSHLWQLLRHPPLSPRPPPCQGGISGQSLPSLLIYPVSSCQQLWYSCPQQTTPCHHGVVSSLQECSFHPKRPQLKQLGHPVKLQEFTNCILVVLLTCKILQFAWHNMTNSKLRISLLLHSLSFASDLISGCSTNRCRWMHFQTELWVCLCQAALVRAETLKWHVYF